ncbi:MAG TPA: hypothetical protein VFR23_24185 [Jiangellaceae bacterium]|nr:hypothetical protein [Jiangellaceae bacterium]
MMDGIMGGVMGLMMLLFVLIVAGAVIVGAIGSTRVIKGLRGPTGEQPALEGRPDIDQHTGQLSALELAKERYARGEIDHAELERLLDVLLRKDQRTGGDR